MEVNTHQVVSDTSHTQCHMHAHITPTVSYTDTHTHTLIRLTGSGGDRRRGDRKVCGGSGGGRGTLDDCRKCSTNSE